MHHQVEHCLIFCYTHTHTHTHTQCRHIIHNNIYLKYTIQAMDPDQNIVNMINPTSVVVMDGHISYLYRVVG